MESERVVEHDGAWRSVAERGGAWRSVAERDRAWWLSLTITLHCALPRSVTLRLAGLAKVVFRFQRRCFSIVFIQFKYLFWSYYLFY